MDHSASTTISSSIPAHTNVVVKSEERARPNLSQQFQPQRQVRYKDKFQALRERYEQVNAIHEDHERALLIAADKERKMQAELDMLLDAVLTSNLTPDLMPYMAEPAVHPHANQNPHPYDPSAFYPNAVEHEAHYSRLRSRPSPYMNGNGNGNGITNGERAWRDAHAAEHAHGPGPGLEYAQAEANGRAP